MSRSASASCSLYHTFWFKVQPSADSSQGGRYAAKRGGIRRYDVVLHPSSSVSKLLEEHCMAAKVINSLLLTGEVHGYFFDPARHDLFLFPRNDLPGGRSAGLTQA